VQGVVFFSGARLYTWYAERRKKHDNAADGIFDAINVSKTNEEMQIIQEDRIIDKILTNP